MKNFIAVAGFFTIISSLVLWFFFNGTSPEEQLQTSNANQTSTSPNEPTTAKQNNNFEEALGLALKGINLVQGENGVELWRLKASWARLSQDGDTIEVDNPVVNYMLGDGSGDESLQVSADKGKITDKQRSIVLWDNILIIQDKKRISASLMTYDATTRLLVFPDGVEFYSPMAKGSASKVTWNLETNIIKATGGVKALLNAAENS